MVLINTLGDKLSRAILLSYSFYPSSVIDLLIYISIYGIYSLIYYFANPETLYFFLV